MTELFLGAWETLQSVKRAIDDQLDVRPDEAPLDDAVLEGLRDSSERHAAMTRKLQDMMFDHGAVDVLHYEVELLRESFESTKREIERRLWARREHATQPSKTPAQKPRRDQEPTLRPNAAVRVFHRDVGYSVQVLEVNDTSARLRQVGRLPADAWVTIRYLHLSIRARVDWSDDTSAGLQFRAPLAPADLQVMREAAQSNHGA